MEKIAHKSASHREAVLWDIQQQIAMTPTERQSAAAELKRRVWGSEIIPIRSLPKDHAARKLHR